MVLLTLAVVAVAPPSLSSGRAVVRLIAEGQREALLARAAPSCDARCVDEVVQGLARVGPEVRTISEGLTALPAGWLYRRVMAVANYGRGMVVEVGLDGAGRVTSLKLARSTTPAPTMAGAYRVRTPLQLPVDGAWTVLWGGRTLKDNLHAAVPDMRYAVDLWIERHGRTFRGRGTRNEDYFAWDEVVRAPADGVVVAVVADAPDNRPNHRVGGELYGNLVVLDHGQGEFSLVAHLRRGSVVVEAGDEVSAGAVLARVGNSGMSTEPHLHLQLMDGPDWTRAFGLPLKLARVTRDGRVMSGVEPRRGEVLSRPWPGHAGVTDGGYTPTLSKVP